MIDGGETNFIFTLAVSLPPLFCAVIVYALYPEVAWDEVVPVIAQSPLLLGATLKPILDSWGDDVHKIASSPVFANTKGCICLFVPYYWSGKLFIIGGEIIL